MKKFNDLTIEQKIDIVKKYYPIGDWDNLLKYFLNKSSVYYFASAHGIQGPKNYWSKEEEKILVDNMYIKSWDEITKMFPGRTKSSVMSHAVKKLGYKRSQQWTKEEIKIMKDYYSIVPMKEFLELLPSRKKANIIMFAKKLGIKSYDKLKTTWTEEQDSYLRENYLFMSDKELSQALGHGVRGVTYRRRSMKLFREGDGGMGYELLANYLRQNSRLWRTRQEEACNYQCIITGDKKYVVHHLCSVKKLIMETLEELNLTWYQTYQEYTKDELKNILELFLKKQDQYKGICINKDIHCMFHHLYGYETDEVMWNEFYNKYTNGEYDRLKKTA